MEFLSLFSFLETSQSAQIIAICTLALLTGSFLNVLIYRLPLIEDYNMAKIIKENSTGVKPNVVEAYNKGLNTSISFPASHCTSCKVKIKWYYNIPLLGWIISKGKCFNCNEKISYQYPIIEFLNLLLWGSAYMIFGYSMDLLFILPMLSLGLVISTIDFNHKILMNGHAEIFGLIGLLYAAFGYSELTSKESIVGSISIFVIVYSFVVLYEKLKRVDYEMMGRGDFYMMGALTAWLGFEKGFEALILASFIGLILFAIKKAIKSKDESMPFIPSLFIAFVILFFDIFQINIIPSI